MCLPKVEVCVCCKIVHIKKLCWKIYAGLKIERAAQCTRWLIHWKQISTLQLLIPYHKAKMKIMTSCAWWAALMWFEYNRINLKWARVPRSQAVTRTFTSTSAPWLLLPVWVCPCLWDLKAVWPTWDTNLIVTVLRGVFDPVGLQGVTLASCLNQWGGSIHGLTSCYSHSQVTPPESGSHSAPRG